MGLVLTILSAVLTLVVIVLVIAEVAMRRQGSGFYKAIVAALQPKATIRFKVIRANGVHEPERLAKTGKVTFLARIVLFKISILMRLKVSLDRLSNYLKQLGG